LVVKNKARVNYVLASSYGFKLKTLDSAGSVKRERNLGNVMNKWKSEKP